MRISIRSTSFFEALLFFAGGKWLIEVNRVLRPGGYFVWSATPVYQKHPEDVDFWNGSTSVLFARAYIARNLWPIVDRE